MPGRKIPSIMYYFQVFTVMPLLNDELKSFCRLLFKLITYSKLKFFSEFYYLFLYPNSGLVSSILYRNQGNASEH